MKNNIFEEKILNLLQANHLLSAPEIVELLKDVNKTTVYRNLKNLVKKNLVQEVNLDSKSKKFELKRELDHQHAVCTNCKKVLGYNINFKKLISNLPKNFEVEDVELNILGRCAKCN